MRGVVNLRGGMRGGVPPWRHHRRCAPGGAPPPCRRVATSAPDAGGTLPLVRDVIHRALYAPDSGYFTQRDVIYAPPAYIDFGALLGQYEYRQTLSRLYAASDHAWLTPVLVFQPVYSHAIARWLVRGVMELRARGGRHAAAPLVVYEVGGGTGTNARHICDYIAAHAPQLYRTLSYTVLEISPALSARQTALLQPHARVARSVVADATRLADAGVADARPCAVVACEVLDNLPHDKVRVRERADGSLEAAEALVVEEEVFDSTTKSARLQYTEDFRPLQEATVREVLESLGLTSMDALHELQADIAATEGAGAGAGLALGMHGLLSGLMSAAAPLEAFIPTGSQRLLGALCQACPEHQFTIADFSWLPPQPSGAILAPVVQTQRGGHTIDMRGDYLRNPGYADILFPTHFGLLARLVGAASKASRGSRGQPVEVSHVSTADFMRRHHDVKTTTTRDGFNPLLDDFVNTRILWTGGDEM